MRSAWASTAAASTYSSLLETTTSASSQKRRHDGLLGSATNNGTNAEVSKMPDHRRCSPIRSLTVPREVTGCGACCLDVPALAPRSPDEACRFDLVVCREGECARGNQLVGPIRRTSRRRRAECRVQLPTHHR